MLKAIVMNKWVQGTVGVVILGFALWFGVKWVWSCVSWPSWLTWHSTPTATSTPAPGTPESLIKTMLSVNGDEAREAGWNLIELGPKAVEPLRNELVKTSTSENAKERIRFCLERIRDAIPTIKQEGRQLRRMIESDRMLKVIEGGSSTPDSFRSTTTAPKAGLPTPKEALKKALNNAREADAQLCGSKTDLDKRAAAAMDRLRQRKLQEAIRRIPANYASLGDDELVELVIVAQACLK